MATPLSYAPISLYEGEQGSGKSGAVVAEAVDVTFANVTSIKLANSLEFSASPALNSRGKPMIGWVTVHLKDKDIVAKCPEGSCVIADTIKIYANFHYYGIRAVYMTMAEIIEHLNDGTISYGYLDLDEHYMSGNAREGMSPVVKVITQLSNQMRKRHLYLNYLSPHARMLDWIERSAVRKHVFCSCDEDTKMITLNIREKGHKKMRTVTYYAGTYFPYYDSDELMPLSETKINRAIASAR
jgi:hypothetical protein